MTIKPDKAVTIKLQQSQIQLQFPKAKLPDTVRHSSKALNAFLDICSVLPQLTAPAARVKSSLLIGNLKQD